jgi:hypothetical protein
MLKKIIWIVLVCMVIPMPAFAGGLSSNWGEVIIANLEPGKEYKLNECLNTSFKITNNFDEPVSLAISPLIPEDKELKPGYVPIRDVSWVDVPPGVVIPAHEQQIIPVRLILPAGAEFHGRKYQFWIWSRTAGQAVGVGLKSRILFSIITKMNTDVNR